MLLVIKFGISIHRSLTADCSIVRITCESSVALDQIQGVDVWRENFEQVCLNLKYSIENYSTYLPDYPFIKYKKLNDFERNIFPNPQSWAGHLLAEMGKHDYPSRALPFMTPVSSGHWANLAFPRVPFRQLGSLIQLMNNEHSLPLPLFCSEMRQRTNRINQRNQQTTSNRPRQSSAINWFIYECSGTWDMKICHLTKQHIIPPCRLSTLLRIGNRWNWGKRETQKASNA